MARFSHLVVCITAVLLISACGELSEFENQQVEEALSDSLFTITKTWGVNMELMENEQLKLILKGSYSTTLKNEAVNITKISGPVYIEIYNDSGEADTFVNADSALYQPEAFTFELFGNVTVDAPENKVLRSEYMKWDRFSDKVSTPEFLTIVTPSDSINAIGFEGDSDLSTYTLREVTGKTIIE
ncbi:LPS export ABC transporter periplasmic protein LptC [Gracilimonas sp.]|uniref:LPS export ABC transporter periplasmic protein LptC n=1 Tax=Gracilimonas sp. TaxID=1974203 RepID=UPI002871D3DD|nr:LPS export ABC transporter periplasmic protein LptC [Gracilimonas sp.]